MIHCEGLVVGFSLSPIFKDSALFLFTSPACWDTVLEEEVERTGGVFVVRVGDVHRLVGISFEDSPS